VRLSEKKGGGKNNEENGLDSPKIGRGGGKGQELRQFG